LMVPLRRGGGERRVSLIVLFLYARCFAPTAYLRLATERTEFGQQDNMKQIKDWLEAHNISEVEALMPDLSGVARGKVMPAQKYCLDGGMRLPEALVLQTITGTLPGRLAFGSPFRS